jgi:hypothetical protein
LRDGQYERSQKAVRAPAVLARGFSPYAEELIQRFSTTIIFLHIVELNTKFKDGHGSILNESFDLARQRAKEAILPRCLEREIPREGYYRTGSCRASCGRGHIIGFRDTEES